MTAITGERTQSSVGPLTTGNVVIGVLGALVLAGIFAGVGRLFMGLGASTGLSDTYPWGIWIGFDFVLIAFSGAGFTMAALVHVFGREKYHPALRPALLAGLMGYAAVLVILVLDLGRFDRFYHFLFFWNFHSPLFEICWCVLLYTTILLIEVSPLLFERLRWRRPLGWIRRAMLPAAIAGVTLSSLHQSTLGTLYLNMPHRLHSLWYTPLLPLLFFLSSIMAGLSLAVIAYTFAARLRGTEAEPTVLSGLARGIGWVTVSYLFLKLGDLLIAGEIPALLSFDRMSSLLWLELGLGAVLPAGLTLIPAVRSRQFARLMAAGLVLSGVFANRFSATLFAQQPPMGTAAYVPHIVEWLTTGGIIAGAALAWYLSVRFLVRFRSEAQPQHR